MNAQDVSPVKSTGEILSDLLKLLGYSGKKRELIRIGKTLARINRRELPYSYKYVHSVLNGSLESGKDFRIAALTYLTAIQYPEEKSLIGLVEIQAYGLPDWSGAQLGGQIRHCANPDCNQKFLTDNNRKWCRVCHPPRRKQ